MLWFPKIILANSIDIPVVPNDEEGKILVRRNGSFTMSDEHDLHETAYFSGATNPIHFTRNINGKFKCDFNLRFFPFDTQNCFIAFTAGNTVRNFISLYGDSLTFTGKTILATFDVIGCEFESNSGNMDLDLKVNIVLKRQIGQTLLTIFLPSIFIMIVAQVGHFQILTFQTAFNLEKHFSN